MIDLDAIARIDTTLDSRSISFENPTGARGAGGQAAGGRKGSPMRNLAPGERIRLGDIAGPGCIRHIWMTFPPAPPAEMRAVWLEVFYDGADQPSISVPALDFFGLAHGRASAFASALTSAQEGRGFNAYFPMPFAKQARLELVNAAARPMPFYYQIDYTLGPVAEQAGYLHVAFRRENPTTLKRDFVIAEGLKGPGRFLGCVVGVRPFKDGMGWYGEGEFKVYRDGDTAHPTICGTGLEDYVGSAWGMGRHSAPYAGVPVLVEPERTAGGAQQGNAMSVLPDFVGFYRWHIADPIVFSREIKVTIQQIGAVTIPAGPDQERTKARYIPAGTGWLLADQVGGDPTIAAYLRGAHAIGIAERTDDYSAAAFLYCRTPQPVPRLDVKAATADLDLRPYEKAPSLI